MSWPPPCDDYSCTNSTADFLVVGASGHDPWFVCADCLEPPIARYHSHVIPVAELEQFRTSGEAA